MAIYGYLYMLYQGETMRYMKQSNITLLFKKAFLAKAAAYHLIYFGSMLTNPFQRA